MRKTARKIRLAGLMPAMLILIGLGRGSGEIGSTDVCQEEYLQTAQCVICPFSQGESEEICHGMSGENQPVENSRARWIRSVLGIRLDNSRRPGQLKSDLQLTDRLQYGEVRISSPISSTSSVSDKLALRQTLLGLKPSGTS